MIPSARREIPETQIELWPDGPVVDVEDLKAEHKRMRAEGLIYDVETAHGTVTLMRHPLLKEHKRMK